MSEQCANMTNKAKEWHQKTEVYIQIIKNTKLINPMKQANNIFGEMI